MENQVHTIRNAIESSFQQHGALSQLDIGIKTLKQKLDIPLDALQQTTQNPGDASNSRLNDLDDRLEFGSKDSKQTVRKESLLSTELSNALVRGPSP